LSRAAKTAIENKLATRKKKGFLPDFFTFHLRKELGLSTPEKEDKHYELVEDFPRLKSIFVGLKER